MFLLGLLSNVQNCTCRSLIKDLLASCLVGELRGRVIIRSTMRFLVFPKVQVRKSLRRHIRNLPSRITLTKEETLKRLVHDGHSIFVLSVDRCLILNAIQRMLLRRFFDILRIFDVEYTVQL